MTDRIIDNDVASQRVVAVDGISISLTDTIQEVKDLATTDGIPVFGSTITADDFDSIQNMVRITPSNKQEVDQLLNYVKAVLKPRDALLVEDTNKHDAYSQTISAEFATAFPDKTHYLLPPQTYDTDPVVDLTGQITSSQLSQIPLDICTSKPDIVLFGGRGKDLATLIGDLASRPCTTPVTIVSGDSVIDTPTDTPVLDGLASGVTVYYPGEYDPGEWSAPAGNVLVNGKNAYPQAKAGYLAFTGEFTTLFHGAGLPDAYVSLAYDATLTSVSAIRLAGGGTPPSPGAVAQELNKLQGPHTVYGASGPIQLSGVYDQVGKIPPQGSNPIGKLVPILRLSARGARSFEALEQVPIPAIGG